jgi:hypothetical protein
MNEHIAATAIYYLDSENITDSNLSFRMQTSAYMNDEYQIGQDAYHWMEQITERGLEMETRLVCRTTVVLRLCKEGCSLFLMSCEFSHSNSVPEVLNAIY